MITQSVYTVGDVARICKVAPRTVNKWFDSGRLRGYRTSGSRDRRISSDSLIRFLKEYGIPIPDELHDKPELTASTASATSDREKASFILGMVRAFLSTGWPKHFNEDDRGQWLQRAIWAKQMMTGGVFNPLYAFAVRELFDEETTVGGI